MNELRVKLFRQNGVQAVAIPRELELPGDEAILRAEDGQLVLRSVKAGSLVAYLRGREPIDEDWPEIDDPLPEPVDL